MTSNGHVEKRFDALAKRSVELEIEEEVGDVRQHVHELNDVHQKNAKRDCTRAIIVELKF